MDYDTALERFNEDMSNSICDGDRKFSTKLLADRIGDAKKAECLRRDWMEQYRQAQRELSKSISWRH
jgi:hypothetical protein